MVWLPRKPSPACPPALSQARSLSSCLLPAHFPRGARPHSPPAPSPSSSRGLAPGLWGTGLTGRLTRAHTAARWLLQQISRCVLVTAWVSLPGSEGAERGGVGSVAPTIQTRSRCRVSPEPWASWAPGREGLPQRPPRCPLQRPPPQTSQTSPCSSVRQPRARREGDGCSAQAGPPPSSLQRSPAPVPQAPTVGVASSGRGTGTSQCSVPSQSEFPPPTLQETTAPDPQPLRVQRGCLVA